MSKTYRLNPETFEEAIERSYLKRKKRTEEEKREMYRKAYTPADLYWGVNKEEDESND